MVLTVSFELDGQEFIALNGGPEFTFDEAISFQVNCESQDEVDRFWAKLSDGGKEGPCGWLKDKFGVSWQIVLRPVMAELLGDPDVEKVERVMKAVLGMGKIDSAELQRVAVRNRQDGEGDRRRVRPRGRPGLAARLAHATRRRTISRRAC